VRAMYLSAFVVAMSTWGAISSVRPLPFFSWHHRHPSSVPPTNRVAVIQMTHNKCQKVLLVKFKVVITAIFKTYQTVQSGNYVVSLGVYYTQVLCQNIINTSLKFLHHPVAPLF